MRHLTAVSTVALLALGLGAVSPALAADLPEYPPIIETPEPLPIQSTGSWYLRGDIGYKIYVDPAGRFDEPGYGSMSNESIDDTGVVGLGVGYRVNDYVRFDATVDYEFAARMKGTLGCPGTCSSSTESADIDAWTGLVNGYVDLGTYSGLTPYVGAGIGASALTTSDVRSSSPGNYSGDTQWNFSWALMAGVGYAISEDLTVDLNYRYLALGDAVSKVPGSAPGTSNIEWNDIAAHEIRVGLRYSFY